ncbi:hypothetical protein D3C72_1903700 [compost metagenome]
MGLLTGIEPKKSTSCRRGSIADPPAACIGFDCPRRAGGGNAKSHVVTKGNRIEDFPVGRANRLRHCQRGRDDARTGMTGCATVAVIDIERARRSAVGHRRACDAQACFRQPDLRIAGPINIGSRLAGRCCQWSHEPCRSGPHQIEQEK